MSRGESLSPKQPITQRLEKLVGGEYKGTMTTLQKSPKNRVPSSDPPTPSKAPAHHHPTGARPKDSYAPRSSKVKEKNVGSNPKTPLLYMKETEMGIIFCGEKCYLSNKYPSKIEHDGHKFNASAQLYEWLRCTELRDFTTADRVLAAPNAAEAIYASKQCRESSKWKRHRLPAMKMCLSKKFRQNKRLRDLLRLTGKLPIIESELDAFWSGNADYVDMCWHSDEGFDGENMLGVLLCELRAQFQADYDRLNNAAATRSPVESDISSHHGVGERERDHSVLSLPDGEDDDESSCSDKSIVFA